MNGYKYTARIREYCDSIDEHLRNVAASWKRIQETCKDLNVISDDHLFWCIDSMIKEHDVSKMSHEEFIPYQRNFFPLTDPNVAGFGEDPDGDAWEAALSHHHKNNKHHWENWTQIKPYAPNELACHCVCMVCDWMAMGLKFDDTAEAYYEANKEKIDLPEWADKFLEEIFERIR